MIQPKTKAQLDDLVAQVVASVGALIIFLTLMLAEKDAAQEDKTNWMYFLGILGGVLGAIQFLQKAVPQLVRVQESNLQ